MDSGWTDSEVRNLISIWADEEIQALLESAKRNKSIYEKNAKEMGKAGFQKTAEQCRDKTKKLESTQQCPDVAREQLLSWQEAAPKLFSEPLAVSWMKKAFYVGQSQNADD